MTKEFRIHPDLRLFIDRVIVPALLERWLREHEGATRPTLPERPTPTPERPAA